MNYFVTAIIVFNVYVSPPMWTGYLSGQGLAIAIAKASSDHHYFYVVATSSLGLFFIFLDFCDFGFQKNDFSKKP